MRLLSTTFLIVIIGLAFAECSGKKFNPIHQQIIGDSLKIVTETRGDTIIKSYKRIGTATHADHIDTSIYQSKAIDTTIKISDFNFARGKYVMYFDTAAAISFCDSVIKETPYDYGNTVNWSIVSSAKQLREFAKSGKPKTIELAGWSADLLNRFSPLIIDTLGRRRAGGVLIEEFTNGKDGFHYYYAITNSGDTVLMTLTHDYWSYDDINLK